MAHKRKAVPSTDETKVSLLKCIRKDRKRVTESNKEFLSMIQPRPSTTIIRMKQRRQHEEQDLPSFGYGKSDMAEEGRQQI